MSLAVNYVRFRGRVLISALAVCLVAQLSVSAYAAGILYSEDFTGPNLGAYDGNTTPFSPLGVPVLESYGSSINARINADRLQMDDGGSASEGLSFGGTTGRYNWATAPFASSLINNGLNIKFDARTGNGGDFISLGFGSFSGVPSGGFTSGTPGFGAIYGYADMDWGWRSENDRQISFLADETTNVSQLQSHSIGNFNWFNVELDLQFTDFNAGSTVTAVARVYEGQQGGGGSLVSTINDTFTLSATDNFVFDLSVNEQGTEVLFDNLTISSVPEPSSILLTGMLACGGLAMARRRRLG